MGRSYKFELQSYLLLRKFTTSQDLMCIYCVTVIMINYLNNKLRFGAFSNLNTSHYTETTDNNNNNYDNIGIDINIEAELLFN